MLCIGNATCLCSGTAVQFSDWEKKLNPSLVIKVGDLLRHCTFKITRWLKSPLRKRTRIVSHYLSWVTIFFNILFSRFRTFSCFETGVFPKHRHRQVSQRDQATHRYKEPAICLSRSECGCLEEVQEWTESNVEHKSKETPRERNGPR